MPWPRSKHAADARGVSTASVPKPKARAAAKRATSFEPRVAAAFGAVIREEREKLCVAQDQFAINAHVDRSYYGKLERGERQPSLALMLRIAQGLGTTASKLMHSVEARLSANGRTAGT